MLEPELARIEATATEPDADAWRAWYVHFRNLLSANPGWFQRIGVVGSWTRLARPPVTRISPRPADRDPASMVDGSAGGVYLLRTAVPALLDGAHWVVRLDRSSGRAQLVRNGEPWGRLLWPYDPLDPPATTRGVTSVTGRRHGCSPRTGRRFRSRPKADSLSSLDALVVRGLMETTGASHGGALRTVVGWPESDAPNWVRDLVRRMTERSRGGRNLDSVELERRLRDRQRWSGWERGQAREHRRIWDQRGICAPDGTPLGTTILTAD